MFQNIRKRSQKSRLAIFLAITASPWFLTNPALSSAGQDDQIVNIYDTLPENAQKFYRQGTNPDEAESYGIPIHHFSNSVTAFRKSMLALTFPFNVWRIRNVHQNEVALVSYKGKYYFKGEGFQFVLLPWSKIERRANVNEPLIQHGPHTIVRISDGSLGYAENRSTGDLILLGPGTHHSEDPQFVYKGTLTFGDTSNNQTNYSHYDEGRGVQNVRSNKGYPLGNQFTLVKIDIGKVGIKHTDKGDIECLQPGLHLIRTPDRLEDIVSVQQEVIDLVDQNRPAPTFYTADNVGLKIESSVYYSLKDPRKGFTNGFNSQDDLEQTIRKESISTLTSIILTQSFSQIGRSQHPDAVARPNVALTPSTEEAAEQITPHDKINFSVFFETTHDEFITQLQQGFGDKYGIEFENIRITGIEFADPVLAGQITKNALLYTTTRAELENLKAQEEIDTKRAEYQSEVIRIEAEAAKQKALLEAQAEAAQTRESAQAEADGIIKVAEAKAKARKLEAEADEEYAKKVSGVELGSKLAVIAAQGEAMSGTHTVLMERIPEYLAGAESLFAKSAK